MAASISHEIHKNTDHQFYKITATMDVTLVTTDHSPLDSQSDSDYDEVVTCSVCDRAFTTARQLIVHQNNRKHFGCSQCDVTFSCVQDLRDHKDKLDHWSDLEEDQAQEEQEQEEEEKATAPIKASVINATVQSTALTQPDEKEETKCHRNNDGHSVDQRVNATNEQMNSCIDEENLIISLTEMERLL